MKKFVKNIITVGVTAALSLAVSVQAATYKIVDKGAVGDLKQTYSQHQNTNGVVAVSGTNLYNFPVQYQYLEELDFKDIQKIAKNGHESIHALNDLEDYDAMVAGNPTANDLAWIVLFLKGKASVSSANVGTGGGLLDRRRNHYYQQVGDTVAMTNLSSDSKSIEIRLLDTTFDGTDLLTRSTVDIITGVTDSGIAYGSMTAPYLPLDFVETDPDVDSYNNEVTYWLRDFDQRGFFSYDNGAQIFQVVPEESSLGGGISAVLDVSENGVAVGYMSYKINQDYKDIIEDAAQGCANEKILAYMPYEICEQMLRSGMYHLMAYKASLNSSGDVITERLGLLVTPHPDDDRTFSSRALGINNNGVVVGYADGWDNENETDPSVNERVSASYAVMFKDGKVFDFNQKHYGFGNYYEFSKAYDINDNGLAVGQTHNIDTGVKKFFYVDTSVNEEEMKIITPTDYFTSSKSTAYAVNNAGFIVGEGEIETHNGSTNNPRRTAAFIYDSGNDKFTNVNDLTACASPYYVVEARDINDDNVISGTAIFKEDRLDAKGNPVLDENGNPEREDIVRAVTLEPIADDGVVCTPEEDQKVVRQGASFSYLLFGLLSLLSIFRLSRRNA
jgi:hypothetical protein